MTIRNSLFLLGAITVCACGDDPDSKIPDLDFRQEMREFVQEISVYAKAKHSNFLIIPQNGQELITVNGERNGDLDTEYLAAIDGTGREDLFYGYIADDDASPSGATDILANYCDLLVENGKTVMVTDYCSTHYKMNDSYIQNGARDYISFAADQRELTDIPAYPSPIYHENSDDITLISQAKNFLYLINPSEYESKEAFLNALKATNYDILLIDLYFDGEALDHDDIESLKVKANGGSRLVISYMSIGEAESYRPYWFLLPHDLVVKENPEWPGNYVVKYWEDDWKKLIIRNDNSYLNKIVDAGFDGVYLDIIEAFETFE